MHVDAALPPVLAGGVDGGKKRPCARCQRRLHELAPRVITVEPVHALTRRLLSPGATLRRSRSDGRVNRQPLPETACAPASTARPGRAHSSPPRTDAISYILQGAL